MHNPDEVQPSDQPETTTFGSKIIGQSIQSGTHVNYNEGAPIDVDYTKCFDGLRDPSQPGAIIDSQSGVAIEAIRVPVNGTMTNLGSSNTSASLLGKLGFTHDQLLPTVGSSQGRIGPTVVATTVDELLTLPAPLTTNSFISSGEVQSLGLDQGGAPCYGLSFPVGGATPQVQSATVEGVNPPEKVTFPFLYVHSDLITGCFSQYLGGLDNTKLNIVGLISKVNSAGNFVFADESSWSFTVDKRVSLTEVRVSLTKPDGTKPRLKGGSFILFKVQRE